MAYNILNIVIFYNGIKHFQQLVNLRFRPFITLADILNADRIAVDVTLAFPTADSGVPRLEVKGDQLI
jgi:hypothetical protein